jgi:hypothetical protein
MGEVLARKGLEKLPVPRRGTQLVFQESSFVLEFRKDEQEARDMARIIPFPKKISTQQVRKLQIVSDALDGIILEAITEKDMDPYEIAGLLAHRLGSLMKNFSQKEEIWDICQAVMKRQASLGKG